MTENSADSGSSNQAKRNDEPGAAQLAAETALTVAVGGTALAVDKAVEAADNVTERASDAIQSIRSEVRDSAESARSELREAVSKDEATRPYEMRTRDELYALAAERDIRGRSTMRKVELIQALRDER